MESLRRFEFAMLWVQAQFAHYQLQTHGRLSLQDYTDFLKRERWKAFVSSNSRCSGFWPSSPTTNFRHTVASSYRITRIFSNEIDGKPS